MADFYIAACSESENGGIYRYSLSENGEIKPVDFTALKKANWMIFSKKRQYFYSTCQNEVSSGGVAAFEVLPSGELKYLNSLTSGGLSCCHIALSPDEVYIYAANYGSGNFAEFKLKNGALVERTKLISHEKYPLGPQKDRQEAAHPHFCGFTPDGRYLLVVDLGVDSIFAYPYCKQSGIDESKVKITRITPAGCGPRHLVFDRFGMVVYLLNELGNSVTSLKYNDGEFEIISSISTLPPRVNNPTKAAAIRLSCDEKYLFASNRGFDSVAVFELDGKGGMNLFDIVLSGGVSPRDINFLGDCRMFAAANEFSDNVMFYDYDNHGRLKVNGFNLVGLPRPLNIIC